MATKNGVSPMEQIDFFVHVNGFYSENIFRPAEIGFAQIFGSEEVDLWTVDLGKLKFTRRDRELNFVEYRERHGILPPYAARRENFYSKVDYKDLEYFFRFLFVDRICDRPPVKTFAVRGPKQLAAFRLFAKDATVVDVEKELGPRPDPPVVATAPRFHSGYHSDKFRGAGCAAEIASSWADFIRDGIRCDECVAAPPEEDEDEEEKLSLLDYDKW